MASKVKKHGEVISLENRTKISMRYHTITKAINKEFWNSNSDTAHSFYVGSYGRGTAINTSDIDILVEIPQSEYQRFDMQKGNGQSRFLQAVKKAILIAYPRSDVHADGQVIVINFTDGMKFEIVPAFQKKDWLGNITYAYPDTNMGGNWKSTNPKMEQEAMSRKNKSSNGLLLDTCKHIRYIRDNYYSSHHLSGILIDAFVYDAIQGWRFTEVGEQCIISDSSFEQELLNYYNAISLYGCIIPHLYAPGSRMEIDASKDWDTLGKILKFMV